MVLGKVHMTGQYARIRVREPGSFIPGSFRTHDVGRKGHTKRIAGRLESTGDWATQSWLIPKKEFSEAKLKQLKLRRG